MVHFASVVILVALGAIPNTVAAPMGREIVAGAPQDHSNALLTTASTRENPHNGEVHTVKLSQLSRRQKPHEGKSSTKRTRFLKMSEYSQAQRDMFWNIRRSITRWDEDADRARDWQEFYRHSKSGALFHEAASQYTHDEKDLLWHFAHLNWKSRRRSRGAPESPTEQHSASPHDIFQNIKNTITLKQWILDICQSSSWDDFVSQTNSGKTFARLRAYYQLPDSDSEEFVKKLDDLGRQDYEATRRQSPKEGELDSSWKSHALFQHVYPEDVDAEDGTPPGLA
ncbi:hypothetical protein FB446DRAFT_20110 [Lentinula raphanica]|nr:hypothetical protein FB446DRAFT_20110 [Lentinula raphanica]